MPMSKITISEIPGVGVVMEAGGDYRPQEGGFVEELMMVAVEAINKALSERGNMGDPQVLAGDKEAIRRVYGDEMAETVSTPSEPAPVVEIKPGTIFRRPG